MFSKLTSQFLKKKQTNKNDFYFFKCSKLNFFLSDIQNNNPNSKSLLD